MSRRILRQRAFMLLGDTGRMVDADLERGLEGAILAHCTDAGIGGVVARVASVHQVSPTMGPSLSGYAISLSANARSCFENLFARVFSRLPKREQSDYVVMRSEAAELIRCEPYYTAGFRGAVWSWREAPAHQPLRVDPLLPER